MDARHGAVAFVLGVVDEQRLVAVQFLFVLLRHASALGYPSPFQGMIVEKQHEQDYGQRETIRPDIGTLLSPDHFRRHVPAFSENPRIVAIRSHIVVVANQHIPVFRIDEEIAIVQILIAEAFRV